MHGLQCRWLKWWLHCCKVECAKLLKRIYSCHVSKLIGGIHSSSRKALCTHFFFEVLYTLPTWSLDIFLRSWYWIWHPPLPELPDNHYLQPIINLPSALENFGYNTMVIWFFFSALLCFRTHYGLAMCCAIIWHADSLLIICSFLNALVITGLVPGSGGTCNNKTAQSHQLKQKAGHGATCCHYSGSIQMILSWAQWPEGK